MSFLLHGCVGGPWEGGMRGEGEPSPSSAPKEVEKLTWPQFRSKHKGKPKEEISSLWAEYKESLN